MASKASMQHIVAYRKLAGDVWHFDADSCGAGDTMDDELIASILEDHNVPKPCGASCRRHRASDIRYLKNTGLLDGYFDYGTLEDMVFTTHRGREYIGMHRRSVLLNSLRDILMGGDTSSDRYRRAVEAVCGIQDEVPL